MWWPAAARNRLSGEMQRRLTCESECWIVREQMPERASQNLGRSEEACAEGGQVYIPYCVIIASCYKHAHVLVSTLFNICHLCAWMFFSFDV